MVREILKILHFYQTFFFFTFLQPGGSTHKRQSLSFGSQVFLGTGRFLMLASITVYWGCLTIFILTKAIEHLNLIL